MNSEMGKARLGKIYQHSSDVYRVFKHPVTIGDACDARSRQALLVVLLNRGSISNLGVTSKRSSW
jgi:hypothetical protein